MFPLAVSLLDRFLSTSLAPALAPPLLLAAACVLIASKLTESQSIAADTLCANAEYDFLPADLRVSGEGRRSQLDWTGHDRADSDRIMSQLSTSKLSQIL